MKVARNALCPCGSGRKYKLCCGTTRAQARADRRRTDALREALERATYFPLLRPDSKEFERWIGRRGLQAPDPALVEEGLAVLSPAERERIVATERELHPEPWKSLCRDIGDEGRAIEALLAGAVVAALTERRDVDPDDLAAIEEDGMEPEEALCFVLEPCDLWSVVEAATAEDVLAIASSPITWPVALGELTERFWSPRHDRRLTVLVERVRAQVRATSRLRAHRVLAGACRRCERDRGFRGLVAAILLGEAAATVGLLERAA